jgi:hypothetical protein
MKTRKLRKHPWSMTFEQMWWLAAMMMMFVLVQTTTDAAGTGKGSDRSGEHSGYRSFSNHEDVPLPVEGSGARSPEAASGVEIPAPR